MGKEWPKNGEKMGFGVIFLFFFTIFGPFFPPISGHFWAIFEFSANAFPIFGFRPVSILYQVA